jgi:hypothetical protein
MGTGAASFELVRILVSQPQNESSNDGKSKSKNATAVKPASEVCGVRFTKMSTCIVRMIGLNDRLGQYRLELLGRLEQINQRRSFVRFAAGDLSLNCFTKKRYHAHQTSYFDVNGLG